MIRLVRSLASHMLTVTSRLLPPHLALWAQAMRRELTEIGDDRAAVRFVAGCLRATLALAVSAQLRAARVLLFPTGNPRATWGINGIIARPRLLGLLCGVGASGFGIAHLLAAGAPTSHILVNLTALALGAVAWSALGRSAALRTCSVGPAVLVLALPLLLTAIFGVTAEGASRWVSIGPVSLQVSFLIMPVMLVLYARRPDEIGTVGMALAALALALQPDPAMAGALSMALLALVFSKSSRLSIIAAAASALASGWAITTAHAFEAVPYVDRILDVAMDVQPLSGLFVLLGAIALVAPAVIGGAGERPVLWAFGGCWVGTLVAAALGNYPTPLVGYGGSAVLGYLLSVALLPARACEISPPGPSAIQPVDGRNSDPAPSELRAAPCN